MNTISVLGNLNSVEMNWVSMHKVLELKLKSKHDKGVVEFNKEGLRSNSKRTLNTT